MYPDSQFRNPVSSFQRPVAPPGVDSDVAPFVCVQFNATWLPYVLGALKQLVMQYTWDTTDPDEINLVQQRAFNLMDIFTLAGQAESENCVAIFRVVGCELQISYDGGASWDDLIDLSTCTVPGPPGPAGPTGPSGPPYAVSGPGNVPETPDTPPSVCNTFSLSGGGDQQVVAPVAVSAGFTIRVYQLGGASADGSVSFSASIPAFSGLDVSPWFCPTGQHYALGSCYGAGSYRSGDPLTSAFHMALIMSVGGTMYDVSAGDVTITVPDGVSNVLPMFQLNDSDITDNTGNFTFKVDICNATDCPSGSDWSHTFDLLSSDGGFTDVNGSAWVSGQGWKGGSGCGSDGTHGDTEIDRAFTSAEITRVVVTANQSLGGSGNRVNEFYYFLGGSGVHSWSVSPVSGSHDYAFDYDATIDTIRIDFNAGCSPAGSTFVTKVVICGKGPEPDWDA